MAQMDVLSRRRIVLQPSGIGFLVALGLITLLYGPGLVATLRSPTPMQDPMFPATMGTYSWYTGMLSSHRFDTASLLYQNGVGVEFMDDPQSVLLSSDGSTYRRLDEAESMSISEDQGDPAFTVLSPDGTFVVIGSAGRTGEILVVTLRDGRHRTVPVGDRRTALPIAVGAEGRTVLLVTSPDTVDRYAEGNVLGLALLDLTTGDVRDFPVVTDVWAAALSPDGRRAVISNGRGLELLDADTGRHLSMLRTSSSVSLDGDAWSPDGSRIAFVDGSDLVVTDVSDVSDVSDRRAARQLPLQEMEYASAIGWRDESTVLVHGFTDTYENTSELYWVDTRTGAQTSFSTYTPNFTGASMLSVDAARNLVPRWHVSHRPVDRGSLPLGVGMILAVLAGIVAGVAASTVRQYQAPPDLPYGRSEMRRLLR